MQSLTMTVDMTDEIELFSGINLYDEVEKYFSPNWIVKSVDATIETKDKVRITVEVISNGNSYESEQFQYLKSKGKISSIMGERDYFYTFSGFNSSGYMKSNYPSSGIYYNYTTGLINPFVRDNYIPKEGKVKEIIKEKKIINKKLLKRSIEI